VNDALPCEIDHRAVNGAPAADFLDDLCQRLEHGEVT
jgi:pyruvate dehydrogenase E2 component (dihydrolipoamide acetyltransferase)